MESPLTLPAEQPFTERREDERRKSRVNKLVHADLHLGPEESRVFLFLVDISLGGMKVNLDRLFEPETLIDLKIPIEPYLNEKEPLEVRCRVAWNRSLLGGTYVHGLEFKELSEQATATVEKLFTAFSPEGQRERFRLKQVLSVAYQREGEWIPWSAKDLSTDGLGLQMRDPLPLDEVFPFKVYLEDQGPLTALEVPGRVVYVAEEDDELHRVGVQFENLDEESASRIRRFIDSALQLK
jgi:c-di-GMP-binding flagellar brake protein YcgR